MLIIANLWRWVALLVWLTVSLPLIERSWAIVAAVPLCLQNPHDIPMALKTDDTAVWQLLYRPLCLAVQMVPQSWISHWPVLSLGRCITVFVDSFLHSVCVNLYVLGYTCWKLELRLTGWANELFGNLMPRNDKQSKSSNLCLSGDFTVYECALRDVSGQIQLPDQWSQLITLIKLAWIFGGTVDTGISMPENVSAAIKCNLQRMNEPIARHQCVLWKLHGCQFRYTWY